MSTFTTVLIAVLAVAAVLLFRRALRPEMNHVRGPFFGTCAFACILMACLLFLGEVRS